MSQREEQVRIRRIDAWALRQPIERPVSTSFGTMVDRPAVFLRLEDQTGGFGWGEVFANWPVAGAEHRVNLLVQDIAALVFDMPLSRPDELFTALEHKTHIRAVQCGELGPFRQVIAGLDIAVWDLFARRAGVPLRRLLNPNSRQRVRAYASGIHVREAPAAVDKARQGGFKAFKVKVGFDLDADVADVKALHACLQEGERLFADANQAWDLPTAGRFLARVGDIDLGWLEEPMPVDAPDGEWQRLARDSSIPLAGGENIAGLDGFDKAFALGALSVYQPDIAKWGGFTGCLEVARRAQRRGRLYCPHFLGGGIGLVASANLLAAAGGEGLLEVDANPNALRDGFLASTARVRDGLWHCDDSVGLGIEALPGELMRFQTLVRSARR